MTLRARSFQAPSAKVHRVIPDFDNVMSIRNATIAMRKRKIGLFEQERIASLDYESLDDNRQRRGDTPGKARKREDPQAKKAARAFRDNY